MKTTVMIIGAGFLQCPLIEEARKLAYTVIATDYNKDAPGFKMADHHIVISTRDIDGTVREALKINQKIQISGVITAGTDASMTVAAVANALGLPGIKFNDAEAATNKIKMRQRFSAHGAPSPGYREIWRFEDLSPACETIGFPCVIKPSDNMGSRGVMKLSGREDLLEGFQFAKSASPSGELILEEYMDGPELSIDAIVYNGEVTFTGIADRIISYPPYFVEIGHTMPTSLPAKDIEKAKKAMLAGIKALGIGLGAAKGDIKLTSKGAMIGEIAARLSGGFMSSHTYPYATGNNILRAALEIAIGRAPSDLKERFHRFSLERALVPSPGVIRNIRGIDKAKKIKGIQDIIINKNVGDVCRSPRSNVEKAMNIICIAESPENGEEIIAKAKACIHFDMEPVSKLDPAEIRMRAFERFNKNCFVCNRCDGIECKGMMPGMGGVDSNTSFRANIEAFSHYRIVTSVIGNGIAKSVPPLIEGNFLKERFQMPVFGAPIAGVKLNLGGYFTEERFAELWIAGFGATGTFAFVGDRPDFAELESVLSTVSRTGFRFGLMVKPHADNADILRRFDLAAKYNAFCVGIDIDACVFQLMKIQGAPVGAKTKSELRRMIKRSPLPVVLKGIMSVDDALNAVEINAKSLIVSNHGGRVMDGMPGSLDVLPGIRKAVPAGTQLILDGGIRSGLDVLKALALGADGVFLGRPAVIYAVGGEEEGIHILLQGFADELRKAMIMTGSKTIKKIRKSVVTHRNP